MTPLKFVQAPNATKANAVRIMLCVLLLKDVLKEDNLNQIINKSDALGELAKMLSVVTLFHNLLALASLAPHILLLSKTQKIKHVRVQHVRIMNVAHKIQSPPALATR